MSGFQVEYLAFVEREAVVSSGNGFCVLICPQGRYELRLPTGDRLLRAGQLALVAPDNRLRVLAIDRSAGEVLLIRMTPEALVELSSEQSNLLGAYLYRDYDCAVAEAPSPQFMLILNAARRLMRIAEEDEHFGNDIFSKGLQMMIAVLIVRVYAGLDVGYHTTQRAHFILDEIFGFIAHHITEEITLDRLEKTFFVSKGHIAREFKRQTGETVHQYILKTRLELCCKEILQGKPISEAYHAGGFTDYNNFFRIFRKYYGTTPKEYYREQQSRL